MIEPPEVVDRGHGNLLGKEPQYLFGSWPCGLTWGATYLDMATRRQTHTKEIAELARYRLRVLSDLSRALAVSAPEVASIATTTAKKISTSLHSGCVIRIPATPSHAEFVCVEHPSGKQQRALKRLVEHAGGTIDALVQQKTAAGEGSLLARRVGDSPLASAFASTAHLLPSRTRVHSFVGANLSLDSSRRATVWLVSLSKSQSYSTDDALLLEDVVNNVTLALDKELQVQNLMAARQAAERTAYQTARLRDFTDALSGAVRSAEVARIAVDCGLAASGGCAGFMATVGGAQELISGPSRGYPADVFASPRRFSVTAKNLVTEAYHRKAPMYCANVPASLEIAAGIRADSSIQRCDSLAIVPIQTARATFGVWVVGFREGMSFSPESKGLIGDIAMQCGPALERALLYEEMQTRLAERLEVQKQLAEADRRKDEFLAMLAHELRNPLASVQLATTVLRQGVQSRAKAERYLEIIERQGNNLAQLINDLTDVSRITQGKIALGLRVQDVQSMIGDAIESVRPLLERKHHTLRKNLPIKPMLVMMDRARMEQVMINLLTNAAKYTAPHGCIEVEIEELNDSAEIRVRDNGMGLKQDVLPGVFDLFSQADAGLARTEGGLGIGLTVVRGLVQLHGGGVQAYSLGPNCGSEFRVRLPLASKTAGDHAQVCASAEDDASMMQACRPRRVLVVDDNVDVQQTIADVLKQYGHSVKVAATGAEAIKVSASFMPELAIVDIGLPEVDGYLVARKLRKTLGASVRLIALTGYAQAHDRQRSLSAGFDDHFVKPLALAALAELAG